MKVTYIICHTLFSFCILAGGATLTFLGGTPWWFWGALTLAVADGLAFSKRMDLWTGKISHSEEQS